MLGYASEAVEEAAADSVGFHQFLPVANCHFHLPVPVASQLPFQPVPSIHTICGAEVVSGLLTSTSQLAWTGLNC